MSQQQQAQQDEWDRAAKLRLFCHGSSQSSVQVLIERRGQPNTEQLDD